MPFEHQHAAVRLLREEGGGAEAAGADDDGVERDVEEQANTRWSLDDHATRFRKPRSQPTKGEATVAATSGAKARTADALGPQDRQRSHALTDAGGNVLITSWQEAPLAAHASAETAAMSALMYPKANANPC